MKCKNIIRVLVSIGCLILASVCFVGCGNDVELKNNERYGFKKVGDQSYLVLDESESNDDSQYLMSELATIEFDSVEEFIDTVTNGKLTDSQLEIANRAFKKDSNGIIICDFNDIQVPVLPKGLERKGVSWIGHLYSFSLESSDGIYAVYHYHNEEVHNYHYESENLFNNENVTVTQVVEKPDSTEYYYSTASGDLKSVRYTLSSGDKELIVHETYRLNMNDKSLQVSDEIPSRVAIFGNSSGKLFYITIFDLKTKPTRKWLNSFDIKAYK